MAMNLTEFENADIVLRVGTQSISARPDPSVKTARFRVLPSGRPTDRASVHCRGLAFGCARPRRKAVAEKLGSSR
jgi:hypothetical protein